MYNIERSIFRCPILNMSDIETYYPAPSEDRLFLMSLKCKGNQTINYVYGDVKNNTVGETYIEIVIYNENIFVTNYRRFIIRRGWMMDEDQEEEFIHLCESKDLEIDYDEFAYLQESVHNYIPDISIRVYEPEEIGRYLLRVYYSTHRSGPKEILYKAGLDRVAELLSSVEDYNMIGNSPKEILGIPIILARILNQPELVNRVRSAELKERSFKIYREFCSYFDKYNIPNSYQWMYLERVEQKQDLFFEKSIFRRLKECTNYHLFENFMKYAKLKTELGKYNPYHKIPMVLDIEDAVISMETIAIRLNGMETKNKKIKKYNPQYVYENDGLIVKTPTTVVEFVEEAIYQESCLMGYIDDVIKGATGVVFVRQKKNPMVPFVTMEIAGEIIIQIRGRFNELPEKEVFEFVEKFARRYGIEYDPYYIIYAEDDDLEDREDLEDYLEDFKRRHEMLLYPDDGIKWEQLTLEDCYPEYFPQSIDSKVTD